MAKMELYFIIGADEAINFQSWHRYKEFAGKCKLLIAKRPNYPEEKLKECCLNFSLQKIDYIIFKAPESNISSSVLRKHLNINSKKRLSEILDLEKEEKKNFKAIAYQPIF